MGRETHPEPDDCGEGALPGGALAAATDHAEEPDGGNERAGHVVREAQPGHQAERACATPPLQRPARRGEPHHERGDEVIEREGFRGGVVADDQRRDGIHADRERGGERASTPGTTCSVQDEHLRDAENRRREGSRVGGARTG